MADQKPVSRGMTDQSVVNISTIFSFMMSPFVRSTMHLMADTVTAHALADLFGVTVRTITDLAKRGVIVRSGNGYALTASVRDYCDHLRKLATRRGGNEATIATATAERGRLAKATRAAQRLPHLTTHDVSEIDLVVRAALTEIGTT
jgi:phage terminase Nu1 subunit (DNA packaging protein)